MRPRTETGDRKEFDKRENLKKVKFRRPTSKADFGESVKAFAFTPHILQILQKIQLCQEYGTENR